MFKKIVEQFFRALARAMEKTVEFAEREDGKIDEQKLAGVYELKKSVLQSVFAGKP